MQQPKGRVRLRAMFVLAMLLVANVKKIQAEVATGKGKQKELAPVMIRFVGILEIAIVQKSQDRIQKEMQQQKAHVKMQTMFALMLLMMEPVNAN